MKRVYCLYRVSTEQQVERDDIPMQRQACHAFANEKGWSIEKEFYEKGVSGFKISAEKRDAVQQIKCAAARQEFDILLVFMFDRLGRRDDETPFVVEWFVRNGIAVWSVKEGEQRFDTHIDKLLNYIQFWQASGESIKTSIRTRTRIEQLTQEGYYTGGCVPYGYRREYHGRRNRQGRAVYDVAVDPARAEIVRMIYHLYVEQGKGTYQIARHLTELGISSTHEDHWHASSIARILQNEAYLGYLKRGKARSDRLRELQIIDDVLFEQAQKMRSSCKDPESFARRYASRNGPPMILLGLVYCGHCGRRLLRGTCTRKQTQKEGESITCVRQRYVCYERLTHRERCTGQTGYGQKTLEEVVAARTARMLWNIQEEDWRTACAMQLRAGEEAIRQQIELCRQTILAVETDLEDLNREVVKALRGESEMGTAVLQGAIEHTKIRLQNEKQKRRELEDKLKAAGWRQENFLKVSRRAGSLLEALHSEDTQAMMEVLRCLIERIDVYSVDEIKIKYHFDAAVEKKVHPQEDQTVEKLVYQGSNWDRNLNI